MVHCDILKCNVFTMPTQWYAVKPSFIMFTCYNSQINPLALTTYCSPSELELELRPPPPGDGGCEKNSEIILDHRQHQLVTAVWCVSLDGRLAQSVRNLQIEYMHGRVALIKVEFPVSHVAID